MKNATISVTARNNDAVITVLSKDHTFKGARKTALDLLLRANSQTIGKYKVILAKNDLAGYAGYALKHALQANLIKVSEAKAPAKSTVAAPAKKTAKVVKAAKAPSESDLAVQ